VPRKRCAMPRSASKCWALLAITSLLPIMPAGGRSTRRKQRGPHHRDRALACMGALDSVPTAACGWLTTEPAPPRRKPIICMFVWHCAEQVIVIALAYDASLSLG
jgi:hypothetical protein